MERINFYLTLVDMVKFTKEESHLRNSLLQKPLTKRGKFLKEQRYRRLNKKESRELSRSTRKQSTIRPMTLRSIQPTMNKTIKSIRNLKVKQTKKKLYTIPKYTKSFIQQSKYMIRFLHTFLDKYESVEDGEKYEIFASELSAGLSDLVGDSFGDYDPADPIAYLTNYMNYLEHHTYEIDPNLINQLYQEFIKEQSTLSQAKYENISMNANAATLGSLFVIEEDEENHEISVGDDILAMFVSMKL